MGVSAKSRLARVLIPLVRAYMRYVPFRTGKRMVWAWLGPRISTRSHKFVSSTVFGCTIAGDTRDFLQRYIYYFGVWEPNLTRWIRERLRSGDTFIDVGTNIGYYALLASKLVGETGSVVAVEASPTIFAQLQSNLVRNRAWNVRAVNKAAAECEKVVKIFLGPEYHLGVTSILEGPEVEFECEATAAPLSTILRPEEARNTRLIKIDVEGAEWFVLQGLVPLLRSFRPDVEFVVEVEPGRLAGQGQKPEDLLELMADAGGVGGFGRHVAEPQVPPRWESAVEISLEDSFRGGKRRIELPAFGLLGVRACGARFADASSTIGCSAGTS